MDSQGVSTQPTTTPAMRMYPNCSSRITLNMHVNALPELSVDHAKENQKPDGQAEASHVRGGGAGL